MAKVSSATIRLVQKLNRKNKNGEYPLYIVVCYGGRIEKATKISCYIHQLTKDEEIASMVESMVI
jgi:hypothetical protein